MSLNNNFFQVPYVRISKQIFDFGRLLRKTELITFFFFFLKTHRKKLV